MNCIACQINLPDEAKFCLECGAKQNQLCSCGQTLPPSAKFCMECGEKVTGDNQTAPTLEEEANPNSTEEGSQQDCSDVTNQDLHSPPEGDEQEEISQDASDEVSLSTEEDAESSQELPEESQQATEDESQVEQSDDTSLVETENLEESESKEEESTEETTEENSEETTEEVDESTEYSTEEVDESTEDSTEEVEESTADSAEEVEECTEEVAEEIQEETTEEEVFTYEQRLPHQLEFYGASLRQNNDILYSYYLGKLYFFQANKQAVCVANEDGTQQKSLFSCLDHPSSIVVNQTGIYLHFNCQQDCPGIQRYDFNGRHTGTMDVPNHALIKHIYIYEDIVYAAVTELMKPTAEKLSPQRRADICNVEDEKRKDLIYYLNFANNTQNAFNFHGERGNFSLLCANAEEIIFKAVFSDYIDGKEVSAEGYYRYYKENNSISCLSHRICQPHWIVSDKQGYTKYLQENGGTLQGFKIPFFDMVEHIMWVELEDETGNYLEPRTIDSPTKSRVKYELPKWHFAIRDYNFHKIYFDGKRMYYPKDYYTFHSILSDGTQVALTPEDNISGVCEKFLVLNQNIYIDLTAHGLKQHKAETHSLPFIRDIL